MHQNKKVNPPKKENRMKLFSILVSALMLILVFAPSSMAGDFDWVENFSIKADGLVKSLNL